MAAIALRLGADLPAAFGLGSSTELAIGLTDFPELDSWLAQIEKQIARPLTTNEKNTLGELARQRWAQANGVSAKELGAQVHHEDPLEYAHLKPEADPNRLSNLLGLKPPGHAVASRAWDLFRRSLGGGRPTQHSALPATASSHSFTLALSQPSAATVCSASNFHWPSPWRLSQVAR